MDVIAEAYAFELAYRRKPENWRDFRYGMEQMGRDRAQQQLDAAEAARVAQDMSGKVYEKMHNSLAAAAGYTRLS